MSYARFVVVALVASILVTAAMAEERKSDAEEKKADAKVASSAKEPRIWAEVNYYGLFTKDSPRPSFPLFVWDSPTGDADLTSTTLTYLYNRREEDYGMQHGFQAELGGWVTEDCKWGAELGGFWVSEASHERAVRTTPPTGDLTGISGVPFFDTFNNREAGVVLMVDYLGESGRVAVRSEQSFWGVEATGLYNVLRKDGLTLNACFGFRNLNLTEQATFDYERLKAADSWSPYDVSNFYDPAAGATTMVAFSDHYLRDQVNASNHFYGANLGLRFGLKKDRFLLDVGAKLAMGVNDQGVEIRGHATRVEPTGRTLTHVGGIFAQRSNIGQHGEARFTVVPEVNLKVGVEITKMLSFHAGYDFVYLSSAVRAGSQLDRRVDPRQMGYTIYATNAVVPGARGPETPFRTDDFWAHGVTAGFKISF